MLFTVGLTLATSAVNVFYRDVNPVVQIALQLWLYLTPVAYPLSAVSARFRCCSCSTRSARSSKASARRSCSAGAPDWTLTAISASMIVVLFAARVRHVQADGQVFR